jgi:PEP-CTERM motif
MKKLVITGVSLVFIGTASLCGASPITYNVDLTVGTDTVTGDFQTNGYLGSDTLDFGGITWNLLINDGVNQYDLTPSNSSLVMHNSDVTATPTELLYDFDSGNSGDDYWFIAGDLFATGGDEIIFAGGAAIGGQPLPGILVDEEDGVPYQYGALSGDQVIATVATTPEPSSFLLFGTGLLALAGLAGRRLFA